MTSAVVVALDAKVPKTLDKKTVKRFITITDDLVAELESARDISRRLRCDYDYKYCRDDVLEEAEQCLNYYEQMDYGQDIVDCRAIANLAFSREVAGVYDEEGDLTEAAASVILRRLVGAYPNANPHDPEGYTSGLLEDVLDENPLLVVLEDACRHWRKTSKFIPTPAELIELIQNTTEEWRQRKYAVQLTEGEMEDLKKRVAGAKDHKRRKEEEREALRLQEEKNREARIEADRLAKIKQEREKLLVAGDRVQDKDYGLGFVVGWMETAGDISYPAIDDHGERLFSKRLAIVAFDCGALHVINHNVASWWRVLPGEDGFDVPHAARERQAMRDAFRSARALPSVGDRVLSVHSGPGDV